MKNTDALNQFFAAMWEDYCALNPQALAVYKALTASGEKVVNDHIAFRTFGDDKMNIEVLSQHFLKYGYKPKNEYYFEEKKLRAKHFEHPDEEQALVFISELDLKKVSHPVRAVVQEIAENLTPQSFACEQVMYGGRLWEASYPVYERLAQESEYAAWVYAHGYRPNHFTVSVNHLGPLSKMEDLNSFLKAQGFPLNSSGGEIKGSAAQYLEQSSTMANKIATSFREGIFTVPACYYEFAKRYPLPDGNLFKGFIATSADKIFESTNRFA